MALLSTKRAHAAVMTLAVTVGLTGLAQAASFVDVQGHWAQNAIVELSNAEVIGGYPGGQFRPEGNITRAEIATILVKALGLSVPTVTYSSFRDVPANHWAAPYIEAVQRAGLVSGYPGNIFKPSQNISRTEVLAILAKAKGNGMPTEAAADQILSNYADAQQVPGWAEPAVAATVQAGVIANRPTRTNYIDPYRYATRAEVAAMVDNLRDSGVSIATNTNTTITNNGSNTTIQGRVISVPASTEFTATLSEPIHTETAQVGNVLRLKLDQALLNSDQSQIVIPRDSEILGRVTSVKQASRAGSNAAVGIEFYEIVKPNGERIQIQGKVATEDGLLVAGTTKGRILEAAARTAGGAAIGAAVGAGLGPLSGGSVGKGAIYGTAIGAGLGALSAAVDKGNEVVLLPGDRLEILLTEPITVSGN